MPEIKAKSKGFDLDFVDFAKSGIILLVMAFGAIIPQLTDWANELISGEHADAAQSVWGFALLAAVDLMRRWIKNNQKKESS